MHWIAELCIKPLNYGINQCTHMHFISPKKPVKIIFLVNILNVTFLLCSGQPKDQSRQFICGSQRGLNGLSILFPQCGNQGKKGIFDTNTESVGGEKVLIGFIIHIYKRLRLPTSWITWGYFLDRNP